MARCRWTRAFHGAKAYLDRAIGREAAADVHIARYLDAQVKDRYGEDVCDHSHSRVFTGCERGAQKIARAGQVVVPAHGVIDAKALRNAVPFADVHDRVEQVGSIAVGGCRPFHGVGLGRIFDIGSPKRGLPLCDQG
jgi:hypothetical protein